MPHVPRAVKLLSSTASIVFITTGPGRRQQRHGKDSTSRAGIRHLADSVGEQVLLAHYTDENVAENPDPPRPPSDSHPRN